MKIETGETYQFNNAVAVVVDQTDSEITWREEHAKSSFNHMVPRWFFEKFAAPLPNGPRDTPQGDRT